MRLRFERTVPCPPEIAWSLAADPRRMNLWSGPRIEVLSLGDGGHPAGVGALRRVHLPRPFRPRVLDEVVVRAEPPRAFAYRVLLGGSAGAGRGRVALEPAGRRTRLEWELDLGPVPVVLRPLLRRLVGRVFQRNLDRLARAAAELSTPTGLPPVRQLDETALLPALYETAEECLAEQHELAADLGSTDAAPRYLARAFADVTRELIDGCHNGLFEHPAWVLRIVAATHRYYASSLRAWLRREAPAVEAHWAAAFEAMERAEQRLVDPRAGADHGVAPGLAAYLEDDLPRALAQVWARHYATRCDYLRLRADFLAMAPGFAQALPRRRRRASDLERRLRAAFARGERIGQLLVEEAPPVRAAP